MPQVNGTTAAQGQIIIGPGTISIAQFDLFFPNNQANIPVNIGYGYVIVRDNAAPNRQRVIYQGRIYTPGNFIQFSSAFGFSTVGYLWLINFKVPGLAFTATYQ